MKTFIQIAVIACLATYILTQSLYGDQCEQNTDCADTQNLQCMDGQCSCLSGFTRNSLRGCSRTHGGPCQHVLDCNIDKFLKCNQTTSTCDCQQLDRQVFDQERDACVSLVGFTCSHDTSGDFSLYCVEGGYCDMPIVNGSMTHACRCGEGWRITKGRICERPIENPLRP